MKRYSISYAREVNTGASKSGIKFQYLERTDDFEKKVESYKSSGRCMGIRITDSHTKKVVFEDLRKLRGKLLLTYKDNDGIQKIELEYFDLSCMRRDEHTYRYNKKFAGYDVIEIERIIYK